jgi:hypothetical protein
VLVKCTVTKWEGLGKQNRVTSTSGDLFLLNGNGINGIEVRAFNKTKFMFVDNIRNIREKASYIESTDTLSNLKMRIDKTFQSLIVAIPFYTDNVTTKATFTRHLNVETISYVYKDISAPTTRAFVVYYEGGKRFELLSSYDIRQIEALCDTGGITTSAG